MNKIEKNLESDEDLFHGYKESSGSEIKSDSESESDESLEEKNQEEALLEKEMQ